ncbi:Vacuolar inheritance and morphology protein [Spiromyces aspiralis]|uniref:Vacuolar inheritance and morphology protein n=1 Tax=Spiromyces aspiralis TaxID=68401 RepID=A0ACC1HR19_9FUNG|nr:Vacuolar inheritance and morphology protein [Spiromyces aspiralis]
MGGGSGGFMGESDDELARRRRKRRRTSAIRQVLYGAFITVFMLSVTFVLAVMYHFTSMPLKSLHGVKISNVLATDKQLVFNLHVSAINHNVREVVIDQVDLSVFAASAVAPNSTNGNSTATSVLTAVGVGPGNGEGGPKSNTTEPAILVGNISKLDDPLRFQIGSITSYTPMIEKSEIKINNPGRTGNTHDDNNGTPDKDVGQAFGLQRDSKGIATTLGLNNGDGGEKGDEEKWHSIITDVYDLTIRGTLHYSLWQRRYDKWICVYRRIDPSTGAVLMYQAHIIYCHNNINNCDY